MIKYTKIIFNSVFLALLVNMSASADDVKMFSGRPPSAHELGGILFSKPASISKPRMKMRSISFSKQATEPTAVATTPAETVGLPIKFGYNSDKILSESKPFLDQVGQMLNLSEYANERLVIEGHTDAGGSQGYNYKLSQRRAKAVKEYLATNYNIPYDRLTVIGKGESAPLEGRNPFDSENRRVQFYRAP